jgi:hypothetical protein
MIGESRVAAIDIKLLKRIRVQLEISAVQLKKQFDEPLASACFNHCSFNEEVKPKRREHNLHIAQQCEQLADEIGAIVELKEIE